MLVLVAMILADPAAVLSLRCVGSAVISAPIGTTTAAASDNWGNTGYANSVTTAPIEVVLETGFEMQGDTASVFLPAEMRPSFSKSKTGWFPVQDLQTSDTKITGSVKLSFMRTTMFEIDRNTGVMTTKNGYRADCSPIDRAKRKF